ncbi:MAG: hypothetical protein ABH952_07905 [Candidatus Omnitrophota bacterium]
MEFERLMKKEDVSQTTLALKLGISRVRVTQILNLLKLPQEERDRILANGKIEQITERSLRSSHRS